MTLSLNRALATAALLGAAWAGCSAQALTNPPPQDVLSLSASAEVELTRDVLNINFSTMREGSDAAVVQSQLAQALDAALAEARKVAQPKQLEVSTGNFALYPRYAPKGGPTQWQGTAELRVQGRDAQAIARLATRIQTMSVAHVYYSLSREAREQVEGEVAAMAIARFRAKAQAYAQQFGLKGIVVREVQINTNDSGPPRPMPMMQSARAGMAAAEEALPVEAGKAVVSATVSGSVQMR